MIQQGKLELIQKRIVDRLLLVGLIVSIPAAIFSGYRITLMGIKPLFLLDIMLVIILGFTYLIRNRISYRWRLVALLLYVFAQGVFSIDTFGLFGLGLFTLFFATIIVTLIFGLRYGAYSLILSSLVLLYFILGVSFGWVSYKELDFNALTASPYHWISRAVFYLSFATIAVIGLGLIHRDLVHVNKELAESEARFRQLSDLTFEGILIHKDGFIVDANQALCNTLGYTREEVVGINLFDRIPYNSLPHAALQNLREDKSVPFEFNLLRKDGFFSPFEIEGKSFIKDGEKFRVVAIRNISERRKAQDALQMSETRYLKLFEQVNDAIFILEEDRVIDCNATTVKLFQTDRNRLIGKSVVELSPEFQPDGKRSNVKAFQLLAELALKSFHRFEWDHIRADGSLINTEVSLSKLPSADKQLTLAIVRDMTERNTFEKRMLNAVTETEERERAKMAADLHDEVGPLLSSLNMYLSLIRREEVANKAELLSTMETLLKESITSIREISNNLSPHMLLNYGLIPALRLFVELKSGLVHITLQENIGDRRFPGTVEITLYRIVKECVNNSLKYASASRIVIELNEQDHQLSLAYRDDGQGFDSSELLKKEHKGIGLLNIINRVNSLNGRYSLDSSPGKGFSLVLSIRTDQ